uniref:Uncharacterized protein n=1 Tax=Oryza barthii TaxID=65489 RepID=A0A0D3GMG3_9ORYZ
MSSSFSLSLYLDRTLGPRGVALPEQASQHGRVDPRHHGGGRRRRHAMLVTLCNPPVNVLHPIRAQGEVRGGMDRDEVKAIVLTDTGGKFCGGFNINVFTEAHKTVAASVPQHHPDLHRLHPCLHHRLQSRQRRRRNR